MADLCDGLFGLSIIQKARIKLTLVGWMFTLVLLHFRSYHDDYSGIIHIRMLAINQIVHLCQYVADGFIS
jgi:hypothetical protein